MRLAPRSPSPRVIAVEQKDPYTGADALADAAPDVWITKWVDYSSKYGVGYLLSDGSYGVCFNDSTKIVLSGSSFDYISRNSKDWPETRSSHSLDDYPEDVKKKVTLLKHFRNYLSSGTGNREGATVGGSIMPHDRARKAVHEPGQAEYVRRWTKNKQATLFQLSNKVVHVIFSDGSEVVLASKAQAVMYVDKAGQVNHHSLSGAIDMKNPALVKRLRYTREILLSLPSARGAELVPP